LKKYSEQNEWHVSKFMLSGFITPIYVDIFYFKFSIASFLCKFEKNPCKKKCFGCNRIAFSLMKKRSVILRE
jgi:hypothetical protein